MSNELKDLSREELIKMANDMGIEFKNNISTKNLVKKIEADLDKQATAEEKSEASGEEDVNEDATTEENSETTDSEEDEPSEDASANDVSEEENEKGLENEKSTDETTPGVVGDEGDETLGTEKEVEGDRVVQVKALVNMTCHDGNELVKGEFCYISEQEYERLMADKRELIQR